MHVKQMLNKAQSDATISTVEARDAMLGCFVVIHGETLKRGAAVLGKAMSDEDAEKHATTVMRGLLGSDWDRPSTQRLVEVKTRMDQKMNFSAAPADLKQTHDQVCSLIASKAR